MLALWYIILGWKKYNKSFTEQVDFPPNHLPKKQDSKSETKDGQPTTQPMDIRKSDSPKSPSSLPRAPEIPKPSLPKDIPTMADGKKSAPPFRVPDSPKMSGPDKSPISPHIPEKPILPEVPKFSLVNPPKAPESPSGKPESPKFTPKAPPKAPEPVKMSPKAPESPKFAPDPPKLAPEWPKPPPEPFKASPRTPSSPKVPDFGKASKNPEPGPPKSPTSGLTQEFQLPPYLPGSSLAANQKPAMSGDELFAMGTDLRNPPKANVDLRDLSYGRGEFAESDPWKKPSETSQSMPRYKDESRVSNPDSLGSSEDEGTDEE